MAQMPPLRTIANGDDVDAVDPEYNFSTIEAHLRNEVINRDGSVAMQAPLTLFGAPTQPNHAVSLSSLQTIFPTGMIIEYARATLMPGLEGTWEVCNGQSVTKADPRYSALFNVIGYAYGGSGDNFNLPNFMRRMAVGRDPNDVAWDAGKSGGDPNTVAPHTHSTAAHSHAMPHTHSIGHGHGNNFSISGGHHGHTTNATNTATAESNYGGRNFYPAIQSTGGPAAGDYMQTRWQWVNPNDNLASIGFAGFGFQPGLRVPIPQLATNNDASHTHTLSGGVSPSSDGSGPVSTPNTSQEPAGNTGPANVAAPNGNYSPYTVVTKLIKL